MEGGRLRVSPSILLYVHRPDDMSTAPRPPSPRDRASRVRCSQSLAYHVSFGHSQRHSVMDSQSTCRETSLIELGSTARTLHNTTPLLIG